MIQAQNVQQYMESHIKDQVFNNRKQTCFVCLVKHYNTAGSWFPNTKEGEILADYEAASRSYQHNFYF